MLSTRVALKITQKQKTSETLKHHRITGTAIKRGDISTLVSPLLLHNTVLKNAGITASLFCVQKLAFE